MENFNERIDDMTTMTIRDFLLKHTKVGEVVVFRASGWYTGLTMIDHEDLFIHHFTSKFLGETVKKVERNQWFEINPGTKIQVTEVWYY